MSVTPVFLHQSEALRAYIAWQEEVALAGSVKFGRRPRRDDQEQPRNGKDRWARPADFRQPAPFFERPSTRTGATSFHFDWTPVTKDAGWSGGRAGRDGQVREDPATENEKYACDEEKIERLGPGIVAAYIEDEEKEPGTTRFSSRTVLLMTNIHRKPEIRQRFWRAVYRAEKTPQRNRLAVHVDGTATDEWWRAVLEHDLAPQRLKKLAAKVLAQQGPASRKRRAKTVYVDCSMNGPVFCAAEWTYKVLAALPGWSDDRPCLRKVIPRGGRVQYKLVAELPHELTPAERYAVLAEFRDKFEELGFMFTLVVHAPDRNNHQRNHHIHAVVYDRRCTFIEDRQKWDIELTAEERKAEGLGPKNLKSLHDRSRPDGRFWEAGGEFIRELRTWYAGACDRALGRLGEDRRFDPRRYEQMGIPQVPGTHLGKSAFPLIAAGVHTVVGEDLAARIWEGAEAVSDLRFRELCGAREEILNDLNNLLSDGRLTAGEQAEAKAIRVALAEDMHFVGRDEQALDRLRIKRAMAESCATRVIMECDAVLANIRDGLASKREAARRDGIARRRDDAKNHLDSIAAALQPFELEASRRREEVAAAAARIALRQQQVLALAQTVQERGRSIPSADTVEQTLPEADLGQAGNRSATLDTPTAAPQPTHSKPLPAVEAKTDETARTDLRAGIEEAWRSLRNDVATNGRFVSRAVDGSGGYAYSLVNASPEELEILRHPSMQKRVAGLLAPRFGQQMREVRLLEEGIRKFGLVSLAATSTRQGNPDLDQAVDLFARYKAHPAIRAVVARSGDFERDDRATPRPPKTDAVQSEALAVLAKSLTGLTWLPCRREGERLVLKIADLPKELRSAALEFQSTKLIRKVLADEEARRNVELRELLSFISNATCRLDDPTDPVFPETHAGRFPARLSGRVRHYFDEYDELRDAVEACHARLEEPARIAAFERAQARDRLEDERRARAVILDRIFLYEPKPDDRRAFERLDEALRAVPMKIALVVKDDGLRFAIRDRDLGDDLSRATSSPDLWSWLQKAADCLPFKHQDVKDDWLIADARYQYLTLPQHMPGIWQSLYGPKKRKRRKNAGHRQSMAAGYQARRNGPGR